MRFISVSGKRWAQFKPYPSASPSRWAGIHAASRPKPPRLQDVGPDVQLTQATLATPDVSGLARVFHGAQAQGAWRKSGSADRPCVAYDGVEGAIWERQGVAITGHLTPSVA